MPCSASGKVVSPRHTTAFGSLDCAAAWNVSIPRGARPHSGSTPAFSIGGSESWRGSTIRHRQCCTHPQRQLLWLDRLDIKNAVCQLSTHVGTTATRDEISIKRVLRY